MASTKPLPLSEQGVAKMESAHEFIGSFSFDDEDMETMLKILVGSLETDKYMVAAKGFMAGHTREFNGRITVLVKRQNKLYRKETIQLEGTGCGTIAVMEWIEAHGCPDLDTVFFNEGQREVLTVSNMKDNELFIERDKNGDIDWYEVPVNGKTALRYHESFWWVFKINSKYYFATA